MYLVLAMALVGSLGLSATGIEAAPIDTLKARQILAGILGVAPNSSDLSMIVSALPLHGGARLIEGSAPGPHTPRRAYLGILPDGAMVPLGCRTGRIMLQVFAPPHVNGQNTVNYAALLAALDGAIPSVGRTVTNPREIPSGMADWAQRQGIALDPPAMRNLPGGGVEVTQLILADALYRVIVRIGPTRDLDGVLSVRLLVGIPPG